MPSLRLKNYEILWAPRSTILIHWSLICGMMLNWPGDAWWRLVTLDHSTCAHADFPFPCFPLRSANHTEEKQAASSHFARTEYVSGKVVLGWLGRHIQCNTAATLRLFDSCVHDREYCENRQTVNPSSQRDAKFCIYSGVDLLDQAAILFIFLSVFKPSIMVSHSASMSLLCKSNSYRATIVEDRRWSTRGWDALHNCLCIFLQIPPRFLFLNTNSDMDVYANCQIMQRSVTRHTSFLIFILTSLRRFKSGVWGSAFYLYSTCRANTLATPYLVVL